MKQIVQYVLCDRKDKHPDSTEEGHEIWLLNSKSHVVAIDLCDPCEKGTSITEARELADAIGQPVDYTGPKTRKPKPAPGPCPDCGEEFDTSQGLGLHRNRSHGIKGNAK